MLIVNAKLIDAFGERDGAVRIESGTICEVGDLQIKSNEQVIDAKNRWLLTGAVDLNFHLRDPGNKQIESIGEATARAIDGGITTILALPDTTPAIDNETVVEYILAKANATEGARILISGEIAKKDQLNNIAKLFKAGVVAIEGKSSLSGNILRRAFEYTLMADRAVFITPKNDSIDGAGVMHDGEVASKMGVLGMPDYAESSEAIRVAEIADAVGSRVVLEAVSAKRSIEAISKLGYSNIFVEVLLPHLLLNETECIDFNTRAKISPPLRSEEDRLALINAVKSGVISLLASGHFPRDATSKDQPFEAASSGISCAGAFLSLAYTHLVKSGVLSMSELMRLVSYNPARLLNENCGEMKAGQRADLVLFDPSIIRSNLDPIWQKGDVYGEVVCAWVAGRVVKNLQSAS